MVSQNIGLCGQRQITYVWGHHVRGALASNAGKHVMFPLHFLALKSNQGEHGTDLAKAEAVHRLDQERCGLRGGPAFVRGILTRLGCRHDILDGGLGGDELSISTNG